MKSIVEKLLEREAQYQLCEKEINGFQYWQYERFNVYRCMRQVDGADLGKGKVNVWQLLKYYLCNSDCLKERKPIDFCFISHPRRQFVNGYYECIYTDALAKKFPASVTLENFFAKDHFRPIYSKNIIYMDRPIIESELYEKLMGLFSRKKRIADQIHRELSVALNGLLKEEQIMKIARHAAGDYYRYKYLRMKFKRILKQTKPKIVIEVVSYGPKCMIINEICKDMGILTIELQHGWLGKEHMAYNYASKGTIRQFPDKICLFGDYYKTRAAFPISKENLLVTGFPYYERELQKYSEYKRQDVRYTVLFLSQGMYAKSLPQMAVDLRKRTRDEEVRILYKLHPIEFHNWQQTFPILQEEGIEIIGLKGMSLYECFASSDMQIGAYSTAIYEGLGFGLRTLIFDQNSEKFAQELIEEGIAERIESVDDIVEKIRNEEIAVYNTNYFWKENALHNLEQTLRDELDQVMQSYSEERKCR